MVIECYTPSKLLLSYCSQALMMLRSIIKPGGHLVKFVMKIHRVTYANTTPSKIIDIMAENLSLNCAPSPTPHARHIHSKESDFHALSSRMDDLFMSRSVACRHQWKKARRKRPNATFHIFSFIFARKLLRLSVLLKADWQMNPDGNNKCSCY